MEVLVTFETKYRGVVTIIMVDNSTKPRALRNVALETSVVLLFERCEYVAQMKYC